MIGVGWLLVLALIVGMVTLTVLDVRRYSDVRRRAAELPPPEHLTISGLRWRAAQLDRLELELRGTWLGWYRQRRKGRVG